MRLALVALALVVSTTNAVGQSTSGPRYDVAPTPFVEIGGDGSGADPLLEDVLSAARLGQEFVVGDSRSSTLLFFDSTGKLLRTTGRRGQGPGEFTGGIFVSPFVGDSLIVWDSRMGRASVFTTSGRFVRQFRAAATRVTSSRTGVLAMLLRPSAPVRDRAGTGGMITSIKLVDFAGDSIGGISDVPWGESRLFGAMTSIAMRGDQLYVGTGSEPAVDVYDRRGRSLRRITFPHIPVRISDTAHIRAVEGLLDAMKAAGAVENLEQQRTRLLAQAIPSTFPPYRELAVAPNGTVWLLTTQLSDSVAHLKGIDNFGSIVSEVDLPIGDTVRLLEAGDDYILLAYVTREGVTKVGAFRIRLRAG